uniref:Shugoshin C-terminal domain-containing protein n=1 Tax=Panagrolaimus sp. PS1159 TaxID=55785 RepID=A0AC35FAA4_9BILA
MLSGRPAPVGSTRDIMDMRNIIENQQTEIQRLNEIIQSQQENYLFLFESNQKIWAVLNNLEKEILSKKVNFEEQQKEKINKSNENNSNSRKKNNDEKERFIQASKIEIQKEQTLSQIHLILNTNPEYAKKFEKIAKNIQTKKHQESEESESKIEKSELATKKHQESDESESKFEKSELAVEKKKKEKRRPSKNHRNQNRHKNYEIVETQTITVERKTKKFEKNNHLSSTINDTLEKYEIPLSSNIQDRKKHRHQNRRCQSPIFSPTICEVTSSESENDSGSEYSNSQLSSDRNYQRQKRRNINDSVSDVTNMPDNFDDDFSSDSKSQQPQCRHHRVGDRKIRH